MQLPNIDIETVKEFGTPIAFVASVIFNLFLRNAVLTQKLDLQTSISALKSDVMQNMNQVKEDLAAHNATLASDVRSHVASDDAKFDEIQRSLNRIENQRSSKGTARYE